MENIISPVTFMKPNEDDLYNALLMEGIISHRDKWDHYDYFGTPIPRVSEILKDTFGKDYLMKWALNLGKEEYDRQSQDTLITGTLVHEMIEYFLLYGTKNSDIKFRSYRMKTMVEQCYQNFLDWYRDVSNLGLLIKPLYVERAITCPWYGGTIDCIMQIGDKIYIIDFKSSKSISIEYLLQTFAYLWAIKWNKVMRGDTTLPDIDGIGIIRIDKYTEKHNTIFLDYQNPEKAEVLKSLELSFSSMLNWYYHQKNLNFQMKNIRKL